MNLNNGTNTPSRKVAVKWAIAFTLIVIMLLTAGAALAITLTKSMLPDTEGANASEDYNDYFDTEIKNSEYITITEGLSKVVKWDNLSQVTKTLTATVLPATAENKAVDWSVAWGDEANTTQVSEYVTVTPTEDGSTTATVTCYKAFTGNIIVTVITRESGYSASCIVTFVGLPTDILVRGATSPVSNFYNLGIGQTHEFTIELTNPFNSVGSQFNNITYQVQGVGSMVLGYVEHYVGSGNDKWFDSSDVTVTLDSLKDNFITVSYANGKLIINTLKSIESYYESTRLIDSGRTRVYSNKFRSYVDDCYFKVIVTEGTSRLSKEIKIRFDDTVVTGVNIETPEIQF